MSINMVVNVINNVGNVINNVMQKKTQQNETVCYAKYWELLQGFVINVMQSVVKLHRNGINE